MNDDRAQVLERVIKIIREALKAPEAAITDATTATDVRGWDSLAHVGIVVAIEKAFKLRFRAPEIAQMQNVGALVDVVLARGKL